MVLGSKNLWTIRQQMAKVTFLLPLPPQEELGCPCYTESYFRSIAQRATPGLLHRELPGLLHRELLPVNCTESFSRSATLQQVSICREGRQGQVQTIVFRE